MTAIAKTQTMALATQGSFSRDQISLIKRTICPDATDDELSLFVTTSQRLGLDPFARQIWAVHRNTKKGPVMSIQVSIDGYRLIAERTGKYLGQDGPYWCGKDGVWHDVWLSPEPPMAAKVGVYKAGAPNATYAVATFSSYAPRDKDGNTYGLWAQMPELMISKCSEALVLRKCFPAELSGVYTDTEMDQATTDLELQAAPVIDAENAAKACTIIEALKAAEFREDIEDELSAIGMLSEGGKVMVRGVYGDRMRAELPPRPAA